MSPDLRVQQLAAESIRRAEKFGYRQHSHQFASFVRGCFTVAVSQHPEIAPLKIQYLKAVGLTV